MSITSRFNSVATAVVAGLIAVTPFYSVAADNGSPSLTKPKMDELDSFEFENYTVRLNGPINRDKAIKLDRELRYLDAHNPEGKDITILINSAGGEVDQGYAILDTIRSLKSEVRTVCSGQCASMAAFLLTAGGRPGKRFVTPNAALMYHQPSSECSGKVTEMEICYNDVKSDKKKMVEGIAAASGLPADQVRDVIGRDWFINPKDAVTYGLIDGILPATEKAPVKIPSRRIPDEVINKILRPN